MVIRKSIFILGMCVLYHCLSCAVHAESNSNRYVWPVEIAGDISGNFGECRWDHFHVGLDIATFGKTGFKIYAIADGYIYRMKASPAGYGRVLYMQLDDGRRVVYAHLERFVPPLQEALSDYQHQMEHYTVDLQIPDERYRFKQGDTIGYSGKSGDVAPHLHIELRTKNDEPINILTHGLSLPESDKTFPKVANVCFKPVAPASFIEGGHTQLILPVESVSPERCSFGSVDAYGSIAIKASVSDTDKTGRYNLAVESVKLFIDGMLNYTVAFDKIGYDGDYGNNFFLYDRELRYSAPDSLQGDYVRLFSLGGKSLQTTAYTAESNGYIHCGVNTMNSAGNILPDGIHTVRIEARDAQGNLTVCEGIINVANPYMQIAAVPWEGGQLPKVDVQLSRFETFFAIDVLNREKLPDVKTIVKIGQQTLSPLFSVRQAEGLIHYVFQPVVTIDGMGTAVVFIGEEGSEAVLSEVSIPVAFMSETGGTFTTDDGKVQLIVEAESRSFVPSAEKVADFTEPPGVKRLSDAYQIRPVGFELPQKAMVRLYVDRADTVTGALAVLEWMNGQWKLLSQISQQKHGWVAAAVTHLSTFAVFTDGIPPDISFISPDSKNSVQGRIEVISGKVHDVGIGIAHQSLVMKINGKKVPAEYIFDQTLFTYTLLRPLPKGMNMVEITAADRLGNTASRRIEFMVEK